MPGQFEVELREYRDVRAHGTPYDEIRRRRERSVRHGADGVRMLRAERQPEPGVDQRGVVGHQDVVRDAAVVDPLRSGSAVQVANVFCLTYGVTRGLDPDVRAPDRGLLRGGQQITGDLAGFDHHCAGSALGLPGGRHLDQRELLVLVVSGKQRVTLAMLLMPLGEQACRGRQIRLLERPNDVSGHTRTVRRRAPGRHGFSLVRSHTGNRFGCSAQIL